MCPHCWNDECEGDETGHCPLDPAHPDYDRCTECGQVECG